MEVSPLISVGIDVSEHFDVRDPAPAVKNNLLPTTRSVTRPWSNGWAKIAPTLIVLEATGGYERQVTRGSGECRSASGRGQPTPGQRLR